MCIHICYYFFAKDGSSKKIWAVILFNHEFHEWTRTFNSSCFITLRQHVLSANNTNAIRLNALYQIRVIRNCTCNSSCYEGIRELHLVKISVIRGRKFIHAKPCSTKNIVNEFLSLSIQTWLCRSQSYLGEALCLLQASSRQERVANPHD